MRDILAKGSYQMGVGPEGGVMLEGGDLFQLGVSVPGRGMAGEDGVSERLRFGPAVGAGEVGVLVEPGRVGG